MDAKWSVLILIVVAMVASPLSASSSYLANANGEPAPEGLPSVPVLPNSSSKAPPAPEEERSVEEIVREYSNATVLIFKGTLVNADPLLVEVLLEALEAIGAPGSCSGGLSVQLVLRASQNGIPIYVCFVECKGVVYKVAGPLGEPLVELASDYEVLALMALSEQAFSAAAYAATSQRGGPQKVAEPESLRSEGVTGNNVGLGELLPAIAIPVCAAAATYAILKRFLF